MTTKDEFVRKMHSKLDLLNGEIDALMSKGTNATGSVRLEVDKQVAALRDKQKTTLAKLSELQQAGDGAWEDLKTGVELAWTAMGEAISSAKSRFGK